jgi:hypothetical protein
MVFAINSDESGPRNFSAFARLAQQLNSTTAAAAGSPTPTGSNGAISLRASGAVSLALTVVFAALF